jgi:6,7-dimethyl-8-ribityllumazine synthase
MRSSSDASDHPSTPRTDLSNARFSIVVAEWNSSVTASLLEGAEEKLLEAGAHRENLSVHWVPGSFEVPYAARRAQEEEEPDAVIALASLIRGETIHFDVIAHSVANAIQQLNLRPGTSPVLFGILTDENMEQAKERAGGAKGNKGEEAAEAAIRLI